MNLIAINGGKRKNHNTARLLKSAVKGAESAGAECETIHLYDFQYKGCISCFSCKRKNGKSYGRCAVRDELTPILEKAVSAGALIFASPIYFRSMTGEMKSFIERLLFPFLTYTNPPGTVLKRKIRTAYIYTMNNTEEEMKMNGIDKHLSVFTDVARLVFGHSEVMYSFDTYQFDDYSKYVSERFDSLKKQWVSENVFPVDMQKAGELGRKLVM